MFSIKSKHRHGEIAATLTVLTLFVMTVGILFGASLVNQATPATQTEAFGVDGLSPISIPNSGFSVNYDRLDRARSINPKQAILYGTICFDEAPPMNGRLKIEVYAKKTGGTDKVLAGASVEKTANPPQNLKCSTGKPTSFGAVFTKLPTGVTADTLEKYIISLHVDNGWDGSGIAPDTEIATLDKSAVGSLQSTGSGDATNTPTPSGSPTPSMSPTPTTPLPAANKCWEPCTKNDPSNPTSFGPDDTCGDGLVCKWAGVGTPLPDQARCLPGDISQGAGCRCMPTGTIITDKCKDQACVCANIKMCDGRIEISGNVATSGYIPVDESGNPLRFKVFMCETATVAGNAQCDPNKAPLAYQLVSGTSPNFKFERINQYDKKVGISIAHKMYKGDVDMETAVTVPADAKITVDGASGCKNGTGIQAEIKSSTSPTQSSQNCYVQVLNAASPSCKVENVKFINALPTVSPSPTPSLTLTPSPTFTPSPTPTLTEEQRKKSIYITIDNHSDKAFKKIKAKLCYYDDHSSQIGNCVDLTSEEVDIPPYQRGDDLAHMHRYKKEFTVPLVYKEFKVRCESIKLGDDTYRLSSKCFKDPTEQEPDDDGLGEGRKEDGIFYVNVRILGSGGSIGTDPYFTSQGDAADVSGNKCINVDDYSRIVLNYGKTSEHDGFESQTFGDGPSDPKLPEDVNFDGTVNAYDLAIVLSNLNTGSGCAFNQVNQFNLLDSLFK